MSIAVLTQVYDEMRRLAIAGSVNARGDFRLQKLIAPLEQAGAKAPVFAKVGEAVKAAVEGSEQDSGKALLELTTLVNAILYTQGETGTAGALEPIETTDLGVSSAQAGARVLKPLLEALTTTGSGRLELIRDAHERGAFRDIRLVKPALDAIDDVYPEIATLVVESVLPLYGKAILPELKAKFDMKGRAGHPRRLRLMHALDPVGSRETVKQALESGSKEVRVAAIECLGAEPDDLSYLIEQASAKAQEVRQAAYRALSTINDDAAVAVLQTAMNGKDLDLAAESLRVTRHPKLLNHLIAAAEGELAALRKLKDKKETGEKINRLISLLSCLSGRDDPASEGLALKLFGQRDDLAKLKGTTHSGSDLNSEVVHLLAHGTARMRATLVENHAALESVHLVACFHAARRALPADKVFSLFSPYLMAPTDPKKNRDRTSNKRDAIVEALIDRYYHADVREEDDGKEPPLDPRWLDIAVQARDLTLVRSLIRPGHRDANAFLKETFNEVIAKAKHAYDCQEVVAAMVAAQHPEATDAFVAVLEKFGKKSDYLGYWFAHVVGDLPKSALPRIEALIPNLHDRVADGLLGYLQQLREKP